MYTNRPSIIITRETVDKYTEDIAVDGSLIQQELGFVPRYGLKDGWEETVKERFEQRFISERKFFHPFFRETHLDSGR